MSGPFSQGQTAGAVSGRPITEGNYSFTVQVTDSKRWAPRPGALSLATHRLRPPFPFRDLSTRLAEEETCL